MWKDFAALDPRLGGAAHGIADDNVERVTPLGPLGAISTQDEHG